MIIERAKTGKSKCYLCGETIQKDAPRMRFKISDLGWGFMVCECCMNNMVQKWVDMVVAIHCRNTDENEIVQMRGRA